MLITVATLAALAACVALAWRDASGLPEYVQERVPPPPDDQPAR